MGLTSFAGGINYAFLLDGLLLPSFSELFDDLIKEIRAFAKAFRPIAYETLYDTPLFLAGAGATAIPAWTVPFPYKLPALIPGLGLMGYSVYRFTTFIVSQREKGNYLDKLEDRLAQGGEAWEYKKNELETLRDELGDEAAAAEIYTQEKKAADVAEDFKVQIEEKKLLTHAELQDLYEAWVDAPTPKSEMVLRVQFQAAAVNLVNYANKALEIEGGWKEQAKWYKTMMERMVRQSTALDALRAISRGDYNHVPGISGISNDAKKHFQGVP